MGEIKEVKGPGKEPVTVCPCGGGEEKKGYKECCGRFHGGVREPDATTLMSKPAL